LQESSESSVKLGEEIKVLKQRLTDADDPLDIFRAQVESLEQTNSDCSQSIAEL